MQQLKSSLLITSLVVLSVLSIGMHSNAVAQSTDLTTITPPGTTQEPVTAGVETLCAQFDSIALNVAADADKRLQEDGKKQTQQDSARQIVRSNLDSKVLETRSKWEQEKQTYYDKLNAKAITEDQKIAVKKFEVAVDSALAKRQAEIDKTRAEYRQKVDAMLSSKRTNLTTALPVLKESVTVAAVEAKNSCVQVSANIPIITSILKGQLIAAQKSFKTSVIGTESIDKELIKLNEERLNEVKKIDNIFKNSEEFARRELRGILGDNV